MTQIDDFANSPFVRRRFSEIWESIAHLGKPQTFGKGEVIYAQGNVVGTVFFLQSGRVKIFMLGADGLERLVTIIEPGNTFCEGPAFDGRPSSVSAVAMMPSVARAFAANQLLRTMTQDTILLQAVLTEFAHKQRILALQVESMSFYSISERVALLLSHLSASYGTNYSDGTGRRVQPGIPLAELASILGVSRVTISREIAKLFKSGVVRKNGREIIILDPHALEQRMPVKTSLP